jgi:hypothetical protein
MSVLILNTDLLRAAGLPLAYELDPSKRLRGWRASAERIEQLRSVVEKQQGAPVFYRKQLRNRSEHRLLPAEQANRRSGPSAVTFPRRRRSRTSFRSGAGMMHLCPRRRARPAVASEDFIPDLQGANPFHGRNALYITDRAEVKPPSTIKDGFERVEMIACIDQHRPRPAAPPVARLRVL